MLTASTALLLNTSLAWREGWMRHESIPEVTAASSGCHSNTSSPSASHCLPNTSSLSASCCSNSFLCVFLFCVRLWPVRYRSRRTSPERWLSGWPTPPSCSTSSSRTETWVASRWTPRTSSPTSSRWPSSQCLVWVTSLSWNYWHVYKKAKPQEQIFIADFSLLKSED